MDKLAALFDAFALAEEIARLHLEEELPPELARLMERIGELAERG